MLRAFDSEALKPEDVKVDVLSDRFHSGEITGNVCECVCVWGGGGGALHTRSACTPSYTWQWQCVSRREERTLRVVVLLSRLSR